jgi:KaiC/GvpD/RAD55 family RecA-like ATPase
LVSNSPAGDTQFHAVRFYQDRASLARLVAGFIGEGFNAALPAIVVATPEHRDAILAELRERGYDVESLQATGELIVLDAAAMLSRVMADGRPSARQFQQVIVPVIEKACRGRHDCVVRLYGEMVDVLWKSGQTVAATRLETLWNQLAQTHAFSLLCGYAMGNFYKDATQEEIRMHHSHVLSDDGIATPVN